MLEKHFRGVAPIAESPWFISTEIDLAGKKIRTGRKNLYEAQIWRSRLGCFPCGIVPSIPENTYDGQETEPGTTSPAPPRSFVQRNCPHGRKTFESSAETHSAELPPQKGTETNERGTCGPSAEKGASPPLFAQWHFIVQAERRLMTAICLTDDAI